MNEATVPGTRPRRAARRPRWWTNGALRVAVLVALGGTGCSLDGLLNSDELPRHVQDPAITDTPTGARTAYVGALAQFRRAFNNSVAETGILSDELSATSTGGTTSAAFLMDQRTLPEGGDDASGTYSAMQKLRGQAGQAIGLLTRHLSDQPALAGHLYALQGYAELFLAELYCSGIPLSTLDFEGDFTYRPGSSTEEVFTHAVALFDTALVLAGDSTRFVDLARLGRARALLGKGEYAAAAAAVAAVPDGYRYEVRFTQVTENTTFGNFFRLGPPEVDGGARWGFTVPDREGVNGMDWRTSGDPRTLVTQQETYATVSSGTIPLYYPNKYTLTGDSPILLASGVEARLIEAEAKLQANATDGQWLTTLNALRTDGTFDTTATSPPDTLWHAGSGGVPGLAPLADPATAAGRVDLLFRERAFWLFLTGHRQGDLRRLLQQYDRLQNQVYPIGVYLLTGFSYGADVTAPIPTTEFINPLYTGCASRGN